MTIEDRVREVLAEEEEREKTSAFQNLKEFYEAMKKEGLVVKQEYTLPPVDTIGSSLFESEPRRKAQSQ